MLHIRCRWVTLMMDEKTKLMSVPINFEHMILSTFHFFEDASRLMSAGFLDARFKGPDVVRFSSLTCDNY